MFHATKADYFRKVAVVSIFVLLLQLIVMPFMFSRVNAGSLTDTYVRLDRMKTAEDSTVRVVFTVPSGNTGTEAEIEVDFSSDWTGNSGAVASTQTVSVADCPGETGATALPGTLTASGSGTIISVDGVTDLSASTDYCFDLTASDAVTNPDAGPYTASVVTKDGSDDEIDSTDVGLRVVSDDQVLVSATVPPSFNFVLDANTTSFASDLDSASVVQTTGRTVTVNTNASNGWIAWAKDSNTGLTSAAAGKTIASTTPGTAATLSAGTEGYVLSAEVTTDAGGGGTPAIATAYQGTSGNNDGSGLDTTYRQIASSDGTADGDVITLRGKAAIAGDTPAATDYTDTWTIIGAGTF